MSSRKSESAIRVHQQPWGEIVASVTLPDGRVVRVVGERRYAKLLAWLRAYTG